MKSIKRGLAVFLATLLIMPTLPVSAQEPPEKTVIEADDLNPGDNAPDAGGTENNQTGSGSEDEADQPQTTSVPETSPEETGSPLPSEDPEETQQPPTPEESPAGTASPEETQTPDPVESPDVSESPDATQEPANSASPEASDAPEASATPTTAIVPDVSGTPSATPTAGNLPAVSATPSGSPTATPSGSPTATPSASPTATPSATPTATPSATPSLEDMEIDEVRYNTGSHAWSVVNREAFDLGAGDAFFEEDGTFTINIPEENPFFPYEVQFTYEDETTNEWFMNPDDTVEIGGHTFHVSAYFDGTAVTQMSLNVAGDTVIVWPEEKEFTDDGDGEMETSLLPLTERYLSADLSAYTPAELTMVSTGEIFTGNNQLTDTDKVVWTRSYSDDYTVSSSGDRLDLSVRTYSSSYSSWEMIVGEADQLAAGNIRYDVSLRLTESEDWLTPTVYTQDSAGNRKSIFVGEREYYDYYRDNRYLRVETSDSEMDEGTQTYVSLSINPSVFASNKFDDFKIYEGMYTTAAEAMTGTDITDQICCGDMTQANAGYPVENDGRHGITMVTFAGGNITGCLPFELRVRPTGSYISRGTLFGRDQNGKKYVEYTYSYDYINGGRAYTVSLYENYPIDGIYYQAMTYYKAGVSTPSEVTAAYVGQYSSIAEAVSKGAADVKGSLFNTDYETGGYGADYSQGVDFTIFVGADGTEGQEIYRYNIKTAPYEPHPVTPSLGSGANVWFYGLKNSEGERIKSFEIDEDSYGENNYVTILVNSDADLTSLAPVFSVSDGATLHIDGSSVAEVSGESFHDFSGGPIHYGVSSEDKNNSRNFWLKVMKASDGVGQLYINSLEDADANTRTVDGVVHSKREMILDGYHSYEHDIIVINRGNAAIPQLDVELVSDVVQLDEYWTLKGNHELSGLGAIKDTYDEKLSNLAKLRLTAKDGVEAGTDVKGTLTFKSGDTVLLVLELTGTVGDPCITTPDIPQAVKYVPYGPLILNNNKYYSWNRVSYSLEDGVLPAGVEVKPNGEIYGVPTETGEFTFTVRMDNSYSNFKPSLKTYTLTVLENTDINVDNSTDEGYDVTQRVQNIYISASGSPDLSEERRTFVSQGIYDEFRYVFLDGVKLTEGQDYTSESGSTRITIMWQTLLSGNASTPGTHTLGVEFRNGEDEILKRAAQNFVIEKENDNNGGSDDGGNSGGSSDDGNGSGNDDSGNTGADNGNATVTAGGAGTGSGGGTNAAGANSTGNGTAGSLAGTGVTGSASTVSYTVESGDTLWKIAGKFYGDGSYWQKIYAENAAVIGSDPNLIYVGQILTIYLNQGDGSVIAGVPAGSETGTTGNYYTVQEGDNLWKIALKVYGRGWRWRRIYEANVNSLPDPQNIYVGQVLLIPD